MSGWGEKLDGVDPEQLCQQLRTETDPKAVKRLTVALLYVDGFSPNRIEQLLGVPAQTAYDWLDVVAEREVTALGDAPRSGRPSYLSAEQWKQLTATLGVVCVRSECSQENTRTTVSLSARLPELRRLSAHIPFKRCADHSGVAVGSGSRRTSLATATCP
jgi:hypothetical protein